MSRPLTGRSFSLGLVGLDLRGLSLEQAFRLAAEWGVDHLDLYNGVNYAADQIDEIPCHARRYDVAVQSISSRAMPNSSPDRRLDEIRLMTETLEHAARVGAHFSESMVGASDLPAADARDQYAEAVYPVIARARELGIVLLVENVHDRDGGADPTATVEGTRALLELIDDPNLALCWDTANFLIGGETSYVLAYERLRPWIRYVQLKDVRRYSPTQSLDLETDRVMVEPTRGMYVSVPTGQGLVDAGAIVQRLIVDVFTNPVSIELFSGPKRRDWYWAESRKWLEEQQLL